MEDENTNDVSQDPLEDVSADTVKIWAVISFLLTLPAMAILSHYIDPGRGRAAGIALGFMIFSVTAFWYLRRHVWFWMSIAILIIVHVALIVFVPWSNRSLPAPLLWPIGIVDFVAIWGFIK